MDNLNEKLSNEELNQRQTDVSSRSIAVNWWNNLPTTDVFRLLKENGYQDAKKPWKYRSLTDKGIYLIWCRENGC